jgi:hypothetical protein
MLRDAGLRDHDLNFLLGMPNLRELHLDCPKVSPAARERFAKFVEENVRRAAP